jgi:hypothetical protein
MAAACLRLFFRRRTRPATLSGALASSWRCNAKLQTINYAEAFCDETSRN